MIGRRGLGWLACAGLLVGCLTPRQTAVVGGSGVALSVVSIVALQPVECGAIVEGDDGGCGRVSFPVGIAAGALAIPLLVGAVLAASIFHYGHHTIAEAKAYLASRGLPVRRA